MAQSDLQLLIHTLLEAACAETGTFTPKALANSTPGRAARAGTPAWAGISQRLRRKSSSCHTALV